MSDTIRLSSEAAAGLTRIGLFGDFCVVEQPDRMAWVVICLKRVPDDPSWFPRGKWATIQSIESQIGRCAVALIDGCEFALRPFT